MPLGHYRPCPDRRILSLIGLVVCLCVFIHVCHFSVFIFGSIPTCPANNMRYVCVGALIDYWFGHSFLVVGLVKD